MSSKRAHSPQGYASSNNRRCDLKDLYDVTCDELNEDRTVSERLPYQSQVPI